MDAGEVDLAADATLVRIASLSRRRRRRRRSWVGFGIAQLLRLSQHVREFAAGPAHVVRM